MSIIEAVKEIVARESSATPADGELGRINLAIRALPNIDGRTTSTQRCREYEIEVGLGHGLRHESEALTRLRSLDIAAAPEVAVLIPLREGHLIVRRYWACPDERLLPVRETTAPLRAGARARFRRDIEVLLESGYVHPFADRGFFHWLVGEASGTIVLDTWSVLTPSPELDHEQLLPSIDALLARRSEPS
jgi:hypothetical protein